MTVPYDGFDEQAFDTFVTETLEEFPTPGIAILVVNGEDTWTHCFGFTDLEEKAPVTPHSLFCIDSLTKSFTAAIAGYVVESPDHPSIGWNTTLADIIPEDFVLAAGTPLGDWATKHVTIEDALSHRTGMARHDMVRTNGDPSLGELVRSLRYLPMKHELRTKWAYTNNMYSAVVHALETATMRSFEDLIKGEILDPLSMDSTTCSVTTARNISCKSKDVRLARGYLWNSDVGKSYRSTDQALAFEPVPWDQIPPCQGGGGMVSNLLDFERWMKQLMNPCGQTLALGEKVVKAMRTPRMLKNADPSSPFLGTHTYGLGLELAVYHGRNIAWHGGAGHGYKSLMLLVPPTAGAREEDKGRAWAVLVLQNSRSRAHGIIAWHLLDHFLKVPKEQHRKMADSARRAEAAARDKFGTASEDRFVNLDPQIVSKPQLPLARYEGLYRHMAFHDMRVSLMPPPWRAASAEADVNAETGKANLRLYLYSGSPKSYHGVSAVLSHLTGESWQAHQSVYISHWESDSLRKLEFDVSDEGNLKGIRLQVDRQSEECPAYFERIS